MWFHQYCVLLQNHPLSCYKHPRNSPRHNFRFFSFSPFKIHWVTNRLKKKRSNSPYSIEQSPILSHATCYWHCLCAHMSRGTISGPDSWSSALQVSHETHTNLEQPEPCFIVFFRVRKQKAWPGASLLCPRILCLPKTWVTFIYYPVSVSFCF